MIMAETPERLFRKYFGTSLRDGFVITIEESSVHTGTDISRMLPYF